jgi:amidase
MSDELASLDATAQADLVRRRQVSAAELTDAAIARIEHLNPTLNAVIHAFFERARAEAKAPADGGPFAGVPFLMKDLMCYTAGDPMHMGTRFLRDADFRTPHDSYLAQKFRRTGVVYLGRTNTPELGTLPATESDAYGPARNPWDTSRSTGGSSGGSAAAVAAGMVPIAHANDGGGSIRIPASECGLVGLKPSRGRTSFGPDLGEGVYGLAVEGIVSRSVRDTATMLDAIAGAMPGDPYTAPPPVRPYAEAAATRPPRLRIGILDAIAGGTGTLHPDCVRAVRETAALLGELGHRVEAAHPEALDDPACGQHFSVVYAANAGRLLDALGEFVGRTLGEADVDPLNWMMAQMGRGLSAPQYLATVDWIQGFTRRLATWWASGFDLLLTPTLPEPPPPLGTFTPDKENPVLAGLRAGMFACFTLPYNMSGQPAISLPLHWTAEGLPVGVQLVAGYGGEDLLLALATELEEARPWSARRPRIHA